MLIKKSRIPIKQIILTGFLPSFIKVFLYRLKGYKIGKNVSIGFGSIVIGESVQIENNTKIGLFTVLRAKSLKISDNIDIGSLCFFDNVNIEIDQDTRIREKVYVGGIQMHDSSLKIGKRVLILQDTVINPTKPIIIEDDVGIGGSCRLFTHASWQSILKGYPVLFKPIVIQRNTWIAWNVFISPGVTIGENSTIGAGSVVTVNIPPNSLGTGSPFKLAVSGVGKWPRKISEKKQNDLIDNIIEEFLKKLETLKFNVEYSENENYRHIIVDKKHVIIYLMSTIDKLDIINKGKYLTIIYNYDTSNYISSEMTIDLKKRVRFGESPLGEELLKYFSHYGIRFERK
jgi:acetyltransferase-like isoleucine patch superfamily enzyme